MLIPIVAIVIATIGAVIALYVLQQHGKLEVTVKKMDRDLNRKIDPLAEQIKILTKQHGSQH